MKNLIIRSFAKDAACAVAVAAALGLAVAAPAGLAGAEELTTTPANRMSVPMAPDAPSSYVVKKGDTLWDISSRFLTQPWYWPEIWYVNPEIKNPHLIYPGDTLRLVFTAEGKPSIRVERGNTVVLSPQVRTQSLDQSIPAIPYEIVAAFMSKPTVIAKDDADKLPYVVATREAKVVGGAGDTIYGRGITGAPGARYAIVHLGDRMKDPDNGDFLGYQGIYVGLARVERAAQSPQAKGEAGLSKLTIAESTRETLQGDRLVGENVDVPLDFVPHAPAQKVDGKVMSVFDGVTTIGQYQVVVINRGRKHGLEPGHVLQVWQGGEKVKDPGRASDNWTNSVTKPFAGKVQLPSEKAGTMMVFRAYDRLSYGLVLSADTVMHVGDQVKSPTL
jgi:hypothetical protein